MGRIAIKWRMWYERPGGSSGGMFLGHARFNPSPARSDFNPLRIVRG